MSQTIAVIGGTGPQGRGLAYRFALGGYAVIIGSRDAAKAGEKAAEIAERVGSNVTISGSGNSSAVAGADIVLLAVPYEGHAELVSSLADQLAGKLVISCVNPLAFDAAGPYAVRVPDGSAAEEAARLAPKVKVVGAFHHVSALNLWKHEGPLSHEDVLVCGDDEDANKVIAELVRTVTGHPGVIVGGLRLARELEPWTAVLININKRFKVRSGIQISGLPALEPTL